MSKPANKAVIGIFVLCAIALVVIAIVVLGSGKFFKRTFTAVCFFEGSVKGLNEGSPVVFRGVKIGSVKGVVLIYDPKDLVIKIPVYIEIDPSHFKPITPPAVRPRPEQNLKVLIDRGLRASLETQSIVTGQKQVGLDFHPDKPANFVGTEPEYPEIPSVQTPLQELAKEIEKVPIEEIFEKLLAAVEGVEKIVNSPEVKGIISSLNLAVEDARKLLQNVDSQVAPLALGIEKTFGDARKLVQNVNTQVQPLSASIKGAADEYGKLARNVDSQIEPLASSIEKSLEEVRVALEQVRKTLAVAEDVLAEDSPLLYELENSLKEVSDAARAIRLLANYLKRHPEALLKGKGKSEGE
jgi:paraquat-inducible protein B